MGPSFLDLVYSDGKGVVALKILNFCLTAPMTRSTCILTFAILLVLSTSSGHTAPYPE